MHSLSFRPQGVPPAWAAGWLVALLALPACARSPAHGALRPLGVTPASVRASLPPPPQGELAFDAAVRHLVARHPELIALRAEAAAIDPDPARVRIDAEAKVRDGEVAEVMLGTEVLALLGLGPRGAQIALARALREEACLRVHERARARVGELAEAYAVHAALEALPALPAAPDMGVWREAGLASDALDEAAAGVAEALEVEAALRAIEMRRAREAISVLVGSIPDDHVVPVAPTGPWPPVAAGSEDAPVLARGDLLRRLAAVTVAERALRVAAQQQWPDLMLRLGQGIDPSTPLQTIGLSIPLDAPRKVAVARKRRDAVAKRLDEGVHAALAETAAAARDAEAAEARVRGVVADLRTVDAVVTAERARLDTTPDALSAWVEVQGRRATLARAERESRVAAARARVRAAVAAGWPSPQDLEVLR
ncbi:MAG: hypothetical protein AB7T63_14035 [Planctomycetota bacterium]